MQIIVEFALHLKLFFLCFLNPVKFISFAEFINFVNFSDFTDFTNFIDFTNFTKFAKSKKFVNPFHSAVSAFPAVSVFSYQK